MIQALRLATVGGVLSFRALFAWYAPSIFLSTMIAVPVMQTLLFVLIGDWTGYQSREFFIVGNAFQVTAMAGIVGAATVIASERRFGTLSHIIGSPAQRWALFLGRSLPMAVTGLVSPWVIFTVALAIGGIDASIADVVAITPLLLAASFSGAALGLVVSAAALTGREAFHLASLVYIGLLVVSGANVAFGDLPAVLQGIGFVAPITHSLQGARDFLSDPTIGFPLNQLLAEIGIGVAWLLVALILLRIFEHRARVTGTIDYV